MASRVRKASLLVPVYLLVSVYIRLRLKASLLVPVHLLVACGARACPTGAGWSCAKNESAASTHTQPRLGLRGPGPGMPDGHSWLSVILGFSCRYIFWIPAVPGALCLGTVCRLLTCTRAHLHTCTLVHLYTCTLAHLHTCTLVHLYTCTLAHLHTCTLAHLHTCTLAHLHTCTLAHLYTCTLAHLHTCTLVHLHTCTRRL